VTDHLADLCLAPTELNREQLLAEAIPEDRIVVTGNPIVGAVTRALVDGADRATTLLRGLGVEPGGFYMATIHRPENTDDPRRLEGLLRALGSLTVDAPVVMPLHPRTRACVERFRLSSLLEPITVCAPLGYDEFVALCARAALTISDSGGVQEEASVWKRPVVVVRRSTERPEVNGTFAHLTDPGPALADLARSLFDERDRLSQELAGVPSPYGPLNAAQRCVDATRVLLRRRREVLA
jgi:UDP-N-acetylglucosamine 2-epimerase (non-hydrolysing)